MLLIGFALLAFQDPPDVDSLLERLGFESIEAREDAAAALRRIGKPALPALEKALAASPNPEVRGRIEDLLGRLRCGDQGGPVVDGLRLHLAVETPELRSGEELRAKVTVWNVTKAPRRLIVGYSATGNYLQLGIGLRALAPGSETPGKLECHVMVCGTGARWMEETIPAYSSISFAMKADYRTTGGKSRYLLGKDWFSVEAPAGSVQRLRVAHDLSAEWYLPQTGSRLWAGQLLSNEVEVKILDAKP